MNPRRLLIVVWSLLLLGACDRCAAKSAPPVVKREPMATTPFDPVPPKVAEAMALRGTQPCAALELLEDAYLAASDAGDVRTAAIALHRQGDVMHDCDDLPTFLLVTDSEAKYRRAYSLYLLHGDDRLAGLAANDLGLEFRGSEEDVRWFTEAVRLRRTAGAPKELMTSLNNLGGALMLADQPDAAVTVLSEVIGIAADAGEIEVERRARTNLTATYLEFVEQGKGSEELVRLARDEALKAQHLSDVLGKNEDVCRGLMTHQYDACHAMLDAGQ